MKAMSGYRLGSSSRALRRFVPVLLICLAGGTAAGDALWESPTWSLAAAAEGTVTVAATSESVTGGEALVAVSPARDAFGWRWSELELPESAARVRFDCTAESADDCLVAYPHLAASPPR